MTSQPLSGKFGSLKQRPQGIKKLFTPQSFRRLVQIAFAGFILYVTIVHQLAGEGGGGASISPEAYCPYGGLETLYKYLTNGGEFISHTHLSNVVLAVAVLVSALLLRSAFCGWICPLGFLQDLIHLVRAGLEKRFVSVRRFFRSLSKSGGKVWPFLDRYLRFVKYAVLIWSLAGAAKYGVMVFRDFDPWAALLTIAEWSFTPGMIVLGLTLVGALFVERPWCRYACPLGAISGLLGKLSPVTIRREAGACTTCKICTKACPMGLEVHTATAITHVDCIGCLECVGECTREGAMVIKVGLPLAPK